MLNNRRSLDPEERTLYGANLQPPAGYVFDAAVATTFSLVLLVIIGGMGFMALDRTRGTLETLFSQRVQTLTEAVYRTWYGEFDRAGGTQLASLLLAFAVLLLTMERLGRGRARYEQSLRRGTAGAPVPLTGWRRWAAPGRPLRRMEKGIGRSRPLVAPHPDPYVPPSPLRPIPPERGPHA